MCPHTTYTTMYVYMCPHTTVGDLHWQRERLYIFSIHRIYIYIYIYTYMYLAEVAANQYAALCVLRPHTTAIPYTIYMYTIYMYKLYVYTIYIPGSASGASISCSVRAASAYAPVAW